MDSNFFLSNAQNPPSLQELKKYLREPSFYHCPENLHVKEHSKLVDLIIGCRAQELENEMTKNAQALMPEGNMSTWGPDMHEGSQSWIGIHPQTLMTPYDELYEIMEIIWTLPIEKVIDLGAAYGRLGFILQAYLPTCKFEGHEIVEHRVDEGNRLYEKYDIENAKLFTSNIMKRDFDLAQADVYFIYDFSNPSDIKHYLKKFALMAEKRNFLLIGRGDNVRAQIHHSYPILNQVYPPVHRENWSIYSTYTELPIGTNA